MIKREKYSINVLIQRFIANVPTDNHFSVRTMQDITQFRRRACQNALAILCGTGLCQRIDTSLYMWNGTKGYEKMCNVFSLMNRFQCIPNGRMRINQMQKASQHVLYTLVKHDDHEWSIEKFQANIVGSTRRIYDVLNVFASLDIVSKFKKTRPGPYWYHSNVPAAGKEILTIQVESHAWYADLLNEELTLF